MISDRSPERKKVAKLNKTTAVKIEKISKLSINLKLKKEKEKSF